MSRPPATDNTTPCAMITPTTKLLNSADPEGHLLLHQPRHGKANKPSTDPGIRAGIRWFAWTMLLWSGLVAWPGCKTASPERKNSAQTLSYRWSEADSLRQLGRPLSALPVVEGLLSQGRSEGKPDEQYRALVYLADILRQTREPGMDAAIARLEQERQALGSGEQDRALQAALEAYLATLYAEYLQQNRWRILERGQRMAGSASEGSQEGSGSGAENSLGEGALAELPALSSWSLEQLTLRIASGFDAALQQPELLIQHPLGDFSRGLSADSAAADRYLRPTLLDVVAHHALTFYRSAESALSQPMASFSPDQAGLFAPAQDFVQLAIRSPDSLDHRYRALRIFQLLSAAHLESADRTVLWNLELERLDYAALISVREDRETLYRQALEALATQMGQDTLRAAADHALASWLLRQAQEAQAQQPYLDPEDPRAAYRVQAERIAQEALTRWPESFGGRACAVLLHALREPELSLQVETVIPPQQEALFAIQYRNTPQVYLRVLPVSESLRKALDSLGDHSAQLALLSQQQDAINWNYTLPAAADRNPHATEGALPPLAAGRYILLACADGLFSPQGEAVALVSFQVSRIACISAEAEGGGLQLFTLDRSSGEPLAGVKLQLYNRRYDYQSRKTLEEPAERFSSKTDGSITIPPAEGHRSIMYVFELGEDRLRLDDPVYIPPSVRSEPETRRRSYLFSDRSIYRPGQTMYVKGILTEQREDLAQQAVADAAITLRFEDANGQLIESQDLRTNRNGTWSAVLTIPHTGLTGALVLRDGHGSLSIQVEAYRRPRFEVVLEAPKTAVKLGDSLQISGYARSYAGASLGGAALRYRVYREAHWPWWYHYGYSLYARPGMPMPGQQAREIAQGTAVLDQNGTFRIAFRAHAADRAYAGRVAEPLYRFRIVADVSEPSGETQSGELSLTLGRAAYHVKWSEMNSNWDRENLPELRLQTLNAADQPVSAALTARLIALNPAGRLLRERLWSTPDQFLFSQAEFARRFPHDPYGETQSPEARRSQRVLWEKALAPGERSVRLPQRPDWPLGEYVLMVFGADDQGQTVAAEQYITLYSSRDARPPLNTYLWSGDMPRQAEPGQTLNLRAVSSESDALLLAVLKRGRQTLQQAWFRSGEGLRSPGYRVQEDDRGGLDLEWVGVRDNRLHRIHHRVDVPWTNRALPLSWERFRDRMEPGSEEQWTLRVGRAEAGGGPSELMLAMYDASLDALLPHRWQPWVFPQNPVWGSWNGLGFGAQQAWARRNNWRDAPAQPFRRYDALYTGELMYLSPEAWYRSGPGVKTPLRGEAPGGMQMAESADKAAEAASASPTPASRTPAPALRSDLRETAFFFPSLQPDENGLLKVSFRVPEALTRWRILGLAHDRQLNLGLLEDTAVTAKDLMVVPNLPRFLREGDRMVVQVRIDNLGQAELSGEATLNLLDANTGQSLNERMGHRAMPVAWKAEAGGSAKAAWLLAVPPGLPGPVRFEFRAASGSLSDGEAEALAVLPRSAPLTRSLAVTARGPGVHNTHWEELARGADSAAHVGLSLEVSSNPAWYAIQALPYLMENTHPGTESILSRYYANAIGSWLAASDPQIAGVFAQWSEGGGLISPLEKNPDLRNIALEETPWLSEAQSESQRIRRLGVLLDANRMRYELEAALSELIDAQSPNGGWPWFPGGMDQPYISGWVVSSLGRLDALGVQRIRSDNRIWSSLAHGVGYLDERALERWKKAGGADKLAGSTLDLHYLCARSYFTDLEIPAVMKGEWDRALREVARHWTEYGLHEQAMAALALHRWSRTLDANAAAELRQASQAIVLSLSERAQRSAELGMWWPENRSGYRWHEAPLETQALLIEAFAEIADDAVSVADMQFWLLGQKRTRAWPGTRATAEACYALLAYGSSALDPAARELSVTLGGKPVEPASAEAGTGYFRMDWPGSEIKRGMADLSLERQGEGSTWAALHWTTVQNIDQVRASGSGLQVEKTLYREVPGPRGPELQPLEPGQGLRIGEKLVTRLLIRVDRDMEFVHLSDARAAGLEPLDGLSGYRWAGGLGYYASVRDATSHYYLDFLPKGTWVFEYESRAFQAGSFAAGPARLQCHYAPEFSAVSAGANLYIEAAGSGR